MARRARTAIVAFLAGLLLVSVGAFAWDAAKKDEVAEGVRVGGVALGGLSADEARARLDSDLVRPLRRPVTATFEGRKFEISPAELRFRADLDGMVDAALGASRDAWLPGRIWRYATGGEVDREIAPRLSYSADELDARVAQIAAELNRPARDATIEPTTTSLTRVDAQEGVTVRTGRLRSALAGAIQNRFDRRVQVPVERVEPDVTRSELAHRYPVYLTVDRGSFQLRLWKHLRLAKTYPIAVGQAGLETPSGLYTINDKQVNPYWHVPDSPWAGRLAGKVIPPGPNNPIQARWMGIYDGAGIHGTYDIGSLGSAASHGCIRMAIPDVIELYDQVPLGTPIYIG